MKDWNNYYEVKGKQDQSPFTRELHGLIMDYLPDEEVNVLDFGCGGGALIAKIEDSRKPCKIVGVDLSAQAIDVVRRNLKSPAHVGDYKILNNFDDNHFDITICSEVFEHMFREDIEPTLDMLIQKTKKLIILTFPFNENISYNSIRCDDCSSRFHPAGHIRKVDKSFIDSLLNDRGLKVTLHYTGRRAKKLGVFKLLRDFFNIKVIKLEGLSCPVCKEGISYPRVTIFEKLIFLIESMTKKLCLFFGFVVMNNVVVVINKHS